MKKFLLLFLAILLAVLIYIFFKYDVKINKANVTEYEQLQQEVQDSLTTSFQSLVSNEDVVFVNAWATWCKPCIEELPELQEFATEHKDVVVKTFSLDDTPAAVDDFLSKRNLALNDMTNLVYPYGSEFLNFLQQKDKSIIKKQSLPISFLIQDGNVVWQKKGVIDFNELENELNKIK